MDRLRWACLTFLRNWSCWWVLFTREEVCRDPGQITGHMNPLELAALYISSTDDEWSNHGSLPSEIKHRLLCFLEIQDEIVAFASDCEKSPTWSLQTLFLMLQIRPSTVVSSVYFLIWGIFHIMWQRYRLDFVNIGSELGGSDFMTMRFLVDIGSLWRIWLDSIHWLKKDPWHL